VEPGRSNCDGGRQTGHIRSGGVGGRCSTWNLLQSSGKDSLFHVEHPRTGCCGADAHECQRAVPAVVHRFASASPTGALRSGKFHVEHRWSRRAKPGPQHTPCVNRFGGGRTPTETMGSGYTAGGRRPTRGLEAWGVPSRPPLTGLHRGRPRHVADTPSPRRRAPHRGCRVVIVPVLQAGLVGHVVPVPLLLCRSPPGSRSPPRRAAAGAMVQSRRVTVRSRPRRRRWIRTLG
jgi:hypothetical protein